MKLDRELVLMVEKITVYKCENCHSVFADALSLENHLAHHNKMFHAHMRSAHVVLNKVKLHHCQECVQCFLTRREYVLHKVKHIQSTVKIARNKQIASSGNNGLISKPYQCPDCDFSFAAASTLEAHSVLHRPFPHVCVCGIGYYTKKDLCSHIKIVHENSTKHPIILPWTPKIEFAAVQETKPDIAINTQARGPKLKAQLLFKTLTVRKPNTKQKHKISKINMELTSDSKFLCPVCKKKLKSKTSLYVHYRTHTGERPYQCKICKKSFTQLGALKIHLERHTGNRKHACPHCQKKFYTAAEVQLHMRTHTGVKPYECSCCGKSFSDPSAFARHERTHTGDKRYICPNCPMRFTDASGLIAHKKRHENLKRFSCETCGKLFYDRSSLGKHVIVHDEIKKKPYCCDYCSKYFTFKLNLAYHIQRMHLKIKKYRCNYCSESFCFSHLLERHMEVRHKVPSDYQCDYCDRLFYSEKSLRRHYMLTHRHVRQRYYECNECSTTYEDKSSITRHILTEHTNISCDKCLEYFPSYSALRNHELDDREPCGVCDEIFFCREGMEQHIKLHMVKKVDD